jgi:hypothetical protein
MPASSASKTARIWGLASWGWPAWRLLDLYSWRCSSLSRGQAGFVVAVELQMLGGGALTLSSSLSWQLC